MSAPIIKIDAISKSFGTFKVLDGLSMQVMPREKLAIEQVTRIDLQGVTVRGSDVGVDIAVA